ncbi:cytochrome c biogenesis protein CcsA [Marinicella sp. S1101]|uniref:cytochrome C assembly family protein n=1 Tax=Marinicella marina TaxID=2996016 RepID=UPI002260AB8B|nr:cytochrome c biogenesis protein CcsA [Marinicella marina]MCX7554658.1 cytochrome c biogenesis protein CcsA [Marinicella marina]MDJ1140723.1 cytochrome c biogenesis protein CcsA [Marinicella marina]
MTYLFAITGLLHLLALANIKKYQVSVAFFILASLCQTVITSQVLLSESEWSFNAQNACLVVSWLSNIIVLLAQFRLVWVRVMVHVIALVILTWIYFWPHPSISKPYVWAIDMHILLSILAYSLLFVSSLISINLGWQIKQMKKNVFDTQSMTINSLLKNEEKLFKLIFLGWLFLSCALLTGVMFVQGFLADGMGHKIIFSLVAWVLFAVLIVGRITKGWRGKKAIKLNLIAMSLLMLGFVGSYLVLDYLV